MNFTDPDTGAHINSTEGMWSAVKQFLRNHTSQAKDMFGHYLAEYTWRRLHGNGLDDKTFKAFLKAVVTLYPPLWKDDE